ncbi:MAG: LysE family translocator [Pelagibacterales bacterium]|jgi:homoserine/homoserine lactone efflux protein|nr:LysE family translocator [Pelagibacterales bacterium]MBL6862245.1 LysE family translocator [Pelagibacterales bacterium]|tara:strand:+ start:1077 stop:1703 length:627 start_codon:yes stop_codon:yes gene_type:complete
MFFDFTLLIFFIPVFFIISITPGLCMTLALTMGMAIGLKQTMKMMVGELVGVLIIASTAVIGGGTIISKYPLAFDFFKYAGGLYLIFVGIQMCRNLGKMSLNLDGSHSYSPNGFGLALQGFVTAIANPKGWAFFMAMVPKFMNYDLPLAPQMTAMIIIIVVIEFISLMIYATSGTALSKILSKTGNVQIINRVAGILMMLVGVWLATS